jgi:hypothetical protein
MRISGQALFILLTSETTADLHISGVEYSFGVLQRAQALGDFRALACKGRRVIRIDLGPDPDEGLDFLKNMFVD